MLTATIVGVIGVAPAMATWTPGAASSPGGVTPTVVADGRCSKVGSAGEHQLKIAKLYQVGTKEYSGPGGATITITSDGKTFSWQISSGFVVNDVTALGSLTPFNHYDYGTPRVDDGNLHAPLLANKLRTLVFGYFCYSAVEVEPGTFSISGRKINDLDADGINDEEPGLGGWTIQVRQGDSMVDSEVTGEGGTYTFSGLEAGEYQVCEDLPEGEDWVQTSPVDCHSVTVGGEGGDAFDIDFLNAEGVDICAQPASASAGGTSATFVAEGGCDGGEVKVVDVSVEEDIVILRPLNTTEVVEFRGTLIFDRPLANPIPPLQYDKDLTGEEFFDVPVCVEGLPPEGDTWCVTGVNVSTEGGSMTVTWNVFGMDDPRFK